MTRRIGIFGCAGFGREVADLVQSQLRANASEAKLVFVEPSGGAVINGIPVVSDDHFLSDAEPRHFVIGIADGAIRKRLYEAAIASGATPLDICAGSAEISPSATLGAGHVVCGHSAVTANTQVGLGFQLNISSYLAHDCSIGDFVTFGPNVVCAGNVIIEDGAYVGASAVIRQGCADAPIKIGAGAVIGMGAVVLSSVAPGDTVVGNPAKPISRRK